MKKLMTLLLMLFILGSCVQDFEISGVDANMEQEKSGSLTYVPDDNFEKALIDLGYDKVLDNFVSTVKIARLKTLDIQNLEISDLTGIENFTNLRKLNCSGNRLTELDMSGNKLLVELRCIKNELKSLNVSNNPELRNLSCRSNKLTALDLSNNTNLLVLRCYKNQLSQLDLSLHSKLSIVNCSYNNLTYLNMNNRKNDLINEFRAKKNPDLKCILVDDPEAANRNETPYDTWSKDNSTDYCTDLKRTYVPDDNFEQALIDMGLDGKLDDYVQTSLISDLRELKLNDIIDATGLEDFINLEKFKLYNISGPDCLKVLDLSNNPNLIELTITEDWGLEKLDISKNYKLEKILLISVYGLDILNTDSCINLKEIACSEMDISKIDLSKNSNLEVISFNEANNISELDLSENLKLRHVRMTNISKYMTSLDFSKNINLESVYLSVGDNLSMINLKNGKNESLSVIGFDGLPNLSCIQVDDAEWSTLNWGKPESGYWSDDCGY